MNEYAHMMGEGEDKEEFTYRLIRTIPIPPEFGSEGGDIYLNFGWYRAEVLRGNLNHEQYDYLLDGLIEQLLAITGPVKPSTEFVGYF